MNDFYTPSGAPVTNAQGLSQAMRTEFQTIQAGFDKFPLIGGQGLKLLRINASGTALETVSPTDLALTGGNLAVGGNLTVSGNTALGDAVGDTLNVANGSLQVDAAGNVGIGIAPGAFKLDVNGAMRVQNITNAVVGGVLFLNASSATGKVSFMTQGTERLRIDSNGNIGVGLVPYAPASLSPSIQLRAPDATKAAHLVVLSIDSASSVGLYSGLTAADNPAVVWQAGTALRFATVTDQGVAGFTERVRIDASGNLLITNASGQINLSPTTASLAITANPTLVDGTARFELYGTTHATLPKQVAIRGDTVVFSGSAASSERMRIDANGNVGIGVTPTAGLHVNKDSGTYIAKFERPGVATNRLAFYNASTSFYIDAEAAGNQLVFSTVGVERMRITSGGDVGIGVSPSYALHVQRTGGVVAMVQSGTNSDAQIRTKTTLGEWVCGTGVGVAVNCWNVYDIGAAAERLRIDSAGNVGIGSAPTAYGAGLLNLTLNAATQPVLDLNVAGVRVATFTGQASGMLIGTMTAAPFSLYTAGVERVRIEASGGLVGNVSTVGSLGVGASSVAGVRLQVTDSSANVAQMSLTNSSNGTNVSLFAGGATAFGIAAWVGNGVLECSGGNGGLTLSAYTGNLLFHTTNRTERMRIDTAGKVGIGGTPLTLLDVLGSQPVVRISASNATVLSGLEFYSSGTIAASLKDSANTGELRMEAGFAGWGGYETFWANGAERMRIDTSGNVGIGGLASAVGNPRLMVAGGVNYASPFYITTEFLSDTGGAPRGVMTGYNNGNTNGILASAYGGGTAGLEFWTYNGSAWGERMRLANSGDLLVGSSVDTNVPVTGLTVYQAGSQTTVGIGHPAGTPNGFGYMIFAYNGGLVGSITQTGTTTVNFNTSSDKRLKTNIVNAPEAGELIDRMKVRSFHWRKDGEHVSHGFVAQELVDVAPQAVSKGDDGHEASIYWGIDPSKLVALLVREIQSLRQRMLKLEACV